MLFLILNISMDKKKLYEKYISKMEEALNQDNFEKLDIILESITASDITQEERDFMSDAIDETTLYLELKDKEYKEEALAIIEEDFKS